MSSTITPAVMPARRSMTPITTPTARIEAQVQPEAPGKVVTLGTVTTREVTTHDGVVKAKHLKVGQTVRPWLHGEPRSSERTVASIEHLDDGAMVRITWSTPHPVSTVKAAYRYHDASLDGTPLVKSVSRQGFVDAR